ncbi:hypothetical protein [Chitinimonas sp. BJB300]|uniref:hypothetical protein n=1 Tax=Chitinimonas sp. BJB300 TaxID=1559339 RepID=UPI0011750293|nr:hypothetical protein [Chitinimonas sp. BJB300]TSJ91576.1 hypothetical protein FG002_004720 [Chitinimonas sp. BJB300]
MRITPFRAIQLAGIYALAFPALADSTTPSPKQIRFVVQGGLTVGGDEINNVQTNRGEDETRAGGLVQQVLAFWRRQPPCQ